MIIFWSLQIDIPIIADKLRLPVCQAACLLAAQQTQNICITFVQRRPNVFDVGPTLYKCYTNVLCLLAGDVGGSIRSRRPHAFHVLSISAEQSLERYIFLLYYEITVLYYNNYCIQFQIITNLVSDNTYM